MNVVIEIVGYIAATTTALIAIPQAVRSVRVGTNGVSALTFQLFLALGVMWSVYGVSLRLWPTVPGNTIQVGACLVTLNQCRVNGATLWEVSRVGIFMVAVTIAAVVVAGPIFMAWIAVAVGFALRGPQLVEAFRSQRIDGISVATWRMATICNVFWLIYAIARQDSRLTTTALLNGSSSYAIIRIVVRRRRAASLRAQAAGSETQAATMG